MKKTSSFFLTGSICLNLFFWLTIYNNISFLDNPWIVISLSVICGIFAFAALFFTIKEKKNTGVTLIMFAVVSMILCLDVMAFQERLNVRGFSAYATKCIVRNYHLKDVLDLGEGMPADVFFAKDDDGSIDLTEIRNYYGHRYVCALQGTIKGEENDGKKLLIIYEYRTLTPLPKTTALELDPSYDTLIFAREQGYANIYEENDAFQYYPIISILKEPKSGR